MRRLVVLLLLLTAFAGAVRPARAEGADVARETPSIQEAAGACGCLVYVDLGFLGVWTGQFAGGLFVAYSPSTGQAYNVAATTLHSGPPAVVGGTIVVSNAVPVVGFVGQWQPPGPNLWRPGETAPAGNPAPSGGQPSPANPSPGAGGSGDNPHT